MSITNERRDYNEEGPLDVDVQRMCFNLTRSGYRCICEGSDFAGFAHVKNLTPKVTDAAVQVNSDCGLCAD